MMQADRIAENPQTAPLTGVEPPMQAAIPGTIDASTVAGITTVTSEGVVLPSAPVLLTTADRTADLVSAAGVLAQAHANQEQRGLPTVAVFADLALLAGALATAKDPKTRLALTSAWLSLNAAACAGPAVSPATGPAQPAFGSTPEATAFPTQAAPAPAEPTARPPEPTVAPVASPTAEIGRPNVYNLPPNVDHLFIPVNWQENIINHPDGNQYVLGHASLREGGAVVTIITVDKDGNILDVSLAGAEKQQGGLVAVSASKAWDDKNKMVQPGGTVLFAFDPAKPDSPIKAFVNGKLVDLDANTAKMLAQVGLADIKFVTSPAPTPVDGKPTTPAKPTVAPTPRPTGTTVDTTPPTQQAPQADATRAPGEVVTLPGELNIIEGGKIICGKQVKILGYDVAKGTATVQVVGASVAFHAKIADLEAMGVLKAGAQPEASCAAPPPAQGGEIIVNPVLEPPGFGATIRQSKLDNIGATYRGICNSRYGIGKDNPMFTASVWEAQASIANLSPDGNAMTLFGGRVINPKALPVIVGSNNGLSVNWIGDKSQLDKILKKLPNGSKVGVLLDAGCQSLDSRDKSVITAEAMKGSIGVLALTIYTQ